MSEVKSDADWKSTAIRRGAKEPFLHLWLLAILASVLWLSYHKQLESLPYVLWVGGVAALIVAVSVVCQWFDGRAHEVLDEFRANSISLDRIGEAMQAFRTELRATSEANEHQAASFRTLTQLIASAQLVNPRDRTVLLLIEDSTVHAEKIRGLLTDLIERHGLDLHIVKSHDLALVRVSHTILIVLDVLLLNSGEEECRRFLHTVHPLCPVVIYSQTKYSAEDFPEARGVFCKEDNFEEFSRALESIILTRR